MKCPAEFTQERVCRVAGEGVFEREDCTALGVGVDVDRWHQVAEQPSATPRLDRKTGALDEVAERAHVKPSRQGIALAPGPVGFVEDGVGLVELAEQCPREDSSEPASGSKRHDTTGRESRGHRSQRRGWVVDDFEDAMAAHHVERVARNDIGQSVSITLERNDPVVDVGFGSASLQGCERIWAGVDDGDASNQLGTQLSEGDGKFTGASAEVEDGNRSTDEGALSDGQVADIGPQRGRADSGGSTSAPGLIL